jgi:outer membrane protein TolC
MKPRPTRITSNALAAATAATALWFASTPACLGETQPPDLTQPATPETSETPAATPGRLSLEQCWNLALQRNRDIQIERINPAIARLSVMAAGAAYDPWIVADNRWENLADSGGLDPADLNNDTPYQANSESSRIALTGLTPSGMTYSLNADYAHSYGVRDFEQFDGYNVRLLATVRQPLLRNLWIDSARYTLRSAKLGVRTSEHALRFRITEVMWQVATAFHELGFAREQRRIRAELRDIRQSLLDNVRRQIQGGVLTALEESQAASQLANAEVDLALADQTVALAANNLRTLLGDAWNHPNQPFPDLDGALAPLPVILDLEESWRDADSDRADLALMRVTRDQSELDIRFWRNQLFPSVDVVAGYGRRGASTSRNSVPVNSSFTSAWDEITDGSNPNKTIGFVFSMPLTRRNERSRFRTAIETRNQADLRIQQLEEWVRREIADAHTLASNARERLELTRKAREFAGAALEAEERKLTSGASAVFFVLQLQSNLAAARIAERRAQTDLLQAIHQIHRCDGTLLRKNGYHFEAAPQEPGTRSTLDPGIARSPSDR